MTIATREDVPPEVQQVLEQGAGRFALFVNDLEQTPEGWRQYRQELLRWAERIEIALRLWDAATMPADENRDGGWRDAIGCAPARPGSISAEEAVRRGRDEITANDEVS